MSAVAIYVVALVANQVDCRFRGADREASTIVDESAHWPPYGKCVYRQADGSMKVEEERWPWVEWALPTILALAAGVAVAGIWINRRRV